MRDPMHPGMQHPHAQGSAGQGDAASAPNACSWMHPWYPQPHSGPCTPILVPSLPLNPTGCRGSGSCGWYLVALELLGRDSFFWMRPLGLGSFRRKGLMPAGSPLLFTFCFSCDTL